MFIHVNGKVAEYAKSERSSSGQYFSLINRPSGDVWFSNEEYMPNGANFPNWYESKEEAYKAAMDYHETEGCALYLELYPAPDKGEWNWIAQDAAGDWYGFNSKPNAYKYRWDSSDHTTPRFIHQSPPNPFWRKTLR